jgi:hypothetical protein
MIWPLRGRWTAEEEAMIRPRARGSGWLVARASDNS